MAIGHGFDSLVTAASGSPLTATCTLGGTVTAGSTLVACVLQPATSTRTYVVTDSLASPGWTKVAGTVQGAASVRQTQIWVHYNHPGGTVQVFVTHNNASGAFKAVAFEVTGTVSQVDANDVLLEGGSSNPHTCSTSGVTTANPCIAVACGTLSATATECAPGGVYIEIPPFNSDNQHFAMYQLFPSGCTAETGAWSNTGTPRIGCSAIVLLSDGAAAYDPVNFPHVRQPAILPRFTDVVGY